MDLNSRRANNNNNNLEGSVCTCGRSEDEEQMKKIQEEIFENF